MRIEMHTTNASHDYAYWYAYIMRWCISICILLINLEIIYRKVHTFIHFRIMLLEQYTICVSWDYLSWATDYLCISRLYISRDTLFMYHRIIHLEMHTTYAYQDYFSQDAYYLCISRLYILRCILRMYLETHTMYVSHNTY